MGLDNTVNTCNTDFRLVLKNLKLNQMREIRNSDIREKINVTGTITVLVFILMFFAGCTKNDENSDPETQKPTDVSPPTIVSVSPGNNTTSASPKSIPNVTFSEELSSGSVTSTSFSVTLGTTIVSGTVIHTGKTATFKPTSDFEGGKTYTVTVTTAVKDIAGNALATNYTWSFTTSPVSDVTAPTVVFAVPIANSKTAATDTKPSVTFNEPVNPTTITNATFSIKQGDTNVPGMVTYADSTATFIPSVPFSAGTIYSGTLTTAVKDVAGNTLAANYTWSFTTLPLADVTAPTVVSVAPIANSMTAATDTKPSVTFNEPMNPTTITTATFSLKQGSTVVPGTVTYSDSTATFTPSAPLSTGTIYTGTITTAVKDVAGNALAANYTWSFTTSVLADVTAPTVVSVVPIANSTTAATDTKPSVTFNEPMNPTTITTATFSMKQGSTVVPGTVTYTGSTATFTPSAPFSAGKIYSGTITTSVKDVAGNALASNYTWSFTTSALADITAPTVVSVVPIANSTTAATDTKPSVTFNEPMNPTTITTATFSIKQGSTVVPGTVTYTGSTATFTPSAPFVAGTIYSVTITSVKDVAGNALAANYTWNFTTAAATPTAKSFSTDVVPILNLCNSCHKHNWTASSTASTFYTNLVNGGYVKPATPTSSKIYSEINGGHPSSTVTTAQKNTILTWMLEGSKNN